jgi:hypothetical protein
MIPVFPSYAESVGVLVGDLDTTTALQSHGTVEQPRADRLDDLDYWDPFAELDFETPCPGRPPRGWKPELAAYGPSHPTGQDTSESRNNNTIGRRSPTQPSTSDATAARPSPAPKPAPFVARRRPKPKRVFRRSRIGSSPIGVKRRWGQAERLTPPILSRDLARSQLITPWPPMTARIAHLWLAGHWVLHSTRKNQPHSCQPCGCLSLQNSH